MTPTQEAAQLLFEARKNRTTFPRLPENLRPKTPQSALSIQREVTRLLKQPVVAWKCSLPQPDRIGVAPIFDLHRKSPVPVVSTDGTKIVEPEIAFVLARDLPCRVEPYTEADIRAAIAQAHLVIEIIGSRVTEFMATSFPEKMADHILNESLFIGPLMTAPIDDRLKAFPLTVSGPDGELQKLEGKHPDGGPFGCFSWLANYLRTEGHGLKKGDIVTTGSYAGFVTVPVGVPLRFTYGTVGTLEVEFKG